MTLKELQSAIVLTKQKNEVLKQQIKEHVLSANRMSYAQLDGTFVEYISKGNRF